MFVITGLKKLLDILTFFNIKNLIICVFDEVFFVYLQHQNKNIMIDSVVKNISKKDITNFVKYKLATNEVWAKKALLAIYSFQTLEEQSLKITTSYNEVGFSGADAEILSNFAEQLYQKGWLSRKQILLLMKKIVKYHRQIINISDTDKLIEMVLKNKITINKNKLS